jgi:hypothetical protein
MNLILYANGSNGAGERLQNAIESIVPEDQTEIYRTTISLYQRLRKPKFDVAVAVLLATTSLDTPLVTGPSGQPGQLSASPIPRVSQPSFFTNLLFEEK